MDDTDGTDEPGTDNGRGFGVSLGSGLRKLVELLESVEQSGRESGEGRTSGPRGSIDYSYTARTIDDDRENDRSTSRPRTVRRRHSSAIPVRIDRDGEDVIVVIDIEDVEREDLTIGVDRSANELVVGVSDAPIERVPIDGDTASIVDVTENNRILEVRVRPREGDDE